MSHSFIMSWSAIFTSTMVRVMVRGAMFFLRSIYGSVFTAVLYRKLVSFSDPQFEWGQGVCLWVCKPDGLIPRPLIWWYGTETEPKS